MERAIALFVANVFALKSDRLSRTRAIALFVGNVFALKSDRLLDTSEAERAII
jgi:hypothetical protein